MARTPMMGDCIMATVGHRRAESNMESSPDIDENPMISHRYQCSDNVLYDEGSSDVRPMADGALSINTPPHSVKDLNLLSLNLDDSAIASPEMIDGNNNNPFHRSLKPYIDTSAYDPPRREIRWERNTRSGNPTNSRVAMGNVRKSRIWISPETQAHQHFLVIRNSMRRLFKNSEVAKWKLEDYINHREAVIASQANKLARKIHARENGLHRQAPPISPDIQHSLRKWGLKGNFDQHGNFGRVLGEQTIWCADWERGKDEIAPWPTMAEMKWEGDDRAKTGVGRFLPLPREQGPPTLPWNQLPVVDQYPIDQVAKIPTMEDIYLPVDDQIEPEMEYLWSQDLQKEMDIFLQS